MKRRSFFAVIVSAVGLAMTKRSGELNSKLSLKTDPLKLIHPCKTSEELRALHGFEVSENLLKMRDQFFKEGKILSLERFSQYDESRQRSELYLSLVFNSMTSKNEYIKNRKDIFKLAKQTRSFSKS